MNQQATQTRRTLILSRKWMAVHLGVLVLLISALAGVFSDAIHGQSPRVDPDQTSLEGLVAKLRQENELVGLAAMVMVDGDIVGSAVDGDRKYRSGVSLEIGDRWHLGSITKSITATMIARLVESNQMKWSTSVGDIFPDASVHNEWHTVTLRQLLTHTAGAPPNFSPWVAIQHPPLGRECTSARRKAVLDVVAKKPVHSPGEKFVYSNVGYTIAGAMAEKATGLAWEDLVKREVFEPLGLDDYGFGPPKSSDERIEQPRGHRAPFGWKMPQDDDADNTPIIGPAGTVHMTLVDLCKYANEHMRGHLGKGTLLSDETFAFLHRPALNDYACGWVMKTPGAESPHTTYWHNGSNTMWYALVVFIPETKTVVAVTSNDGDIKQAESAAWRLVKSIRDDASMTFKNRAVRKTNADESDRNQLDHRQNRHQDSKTGSTSRVFAPIVSALDSIFDSGAAATIPQSPDFDDVSAFGVEDKARIDAWLASQVATARYPSLSAAVVRDGKIVYSGAFGFEDIASGRKANAETSYHVASVTKVFTTTLAAVLHQYGLVDLDDPVADYLPENVSISTTPNVGAAITLRHLASHTSGLPRGVPVDVQSVDGQYRLEPRRLYELLADVEMEFAPGTDDLYSNLGMGLLGHVLELATDEPFDRLLNEIVCRPLRLERTAIRISDKLHVATGYRSEIPRRPETHSFRRRLAPSGGLVTTVDDLAKFLAAQMKPGVFSEDALRLLHTRAKLNDGTNVDRAMGWSVRSRVTTGSILKKNGGRNNCGAWIGFAPEHGVGVAIVTNCGDPSVDDMGYWLLERSVPGGLQSVTSHGYAKLAPFTGVRWDQGRPQVRIGQRWSSWVSIDGIPIDDVLQFSSNEFGSKSRKRIAEDLVELLSKMGHEPKRHVTLGLRSADGSIEMLRTKMTEQNRALARRYSREFDRVTGQ